MDYVGTELETFRLATTWKRYFAERLRPWLGRRVLEVGAGLGANTRSLFCDEVERWLAIEPDRQLAGQLTLALAELADAPRCEARCCTLADLDSGTEDEASRELFDCVLYIDVLEHIEEDSAELARAATHLAPGGRLVMLGPAHNALFSPFDAAVGHFRRYDRGNLPATPPELTLKRVEYLDSVGVTLSAANRLLLRSSAPTQGQIRFWDRVVVPISRLIDPLLLRRLGKSILAVWVRAG